MATNVLGGVDMVKEIIIYSDKCGMKELTKCQDEFAKELAKSRYRNKINIWKYIKDPESKFKTQDDEEHDKGKNAGQGEVFDNVISQNPKINY